MRRGRVAAAAFAILVAGAAAVAWAPRPALAFSWMRPPAPTVATGASFSVSVASLRSADSAAATAGRLEAAGFATFTRGVPTTSMYQVMAGPYVSLDEAERMQQRLAAAGFGGSGLFVDESLRHAPRNDAVARVGLNPSLVLIGAPGRLSLAFEMRSEPRQVTARRADDTTLDIDIGPIDVAVPSQKWTAPAGVHLIRTVAIDDVVGSGSARYVRATLTVPDFARANTRVEGRRVYVDLTWPAEAIAPSASKASPAPESAAGTSVRAASPSREAPVPQERTAMQEQAVPAAVAAAPTPVAAPVESLAPIMAKLERVLPFVQSAAKSPASDVLDALAPTLSEIDGSLKGMTGTTDAAARGLLISATASARRAVSPAFAGDRVAESHQAAGLFEAARALLPATPR
jgi:cell division septation protein DedD